MDRPLSNMTAVKKRKISHDDNGRNDTPLPDRTRHRKTYLSAILGGTLIPQKKYLAIQGILNEQESLIAERDLEIRERCTQIGNLKVDLSRAQLNVEVDGDRIARRDRQLDDLEKDLERAKARNEHGKAKSVQDLRERKQYFENRINEQDQIMNLGRKMLARKTEEAKQFEEDNRQLQANLEERDAKISSLNDQLVRISTASADEIVAMALEAQAQRTLSMVKGLQRDVQERDAKIPKHESQKSDLLVVKGVYKSQIDALNKTIDDKTKALQAAEKQAAEAKDITEDQAKLIKRLMKENARLSSHQQT